MPRRPRFRLVFAPETLAHLDAIRRSSHKLIQATVEEQLSFVPDQATRNRKPLERPTPFGATWELRFGPAHRLRVFYEIDLTTRLVQVLAIGVKERNKLFIGGEEFEP
jgi:mRNA-degrading endonuclease RelE of RelBE toxin-antitoxin system